MKVICPKCKHKGKPIQKMGGKICSKCRTILDYYDLKDIIVTGKEQTKPKAE